MDCRLLHREWTEEESRIGEEMIAADCIVDGHLGREQPTALITGEWSV